ncbi:Holliday junction branch migration protein RuvA [Euzebya tangerina]|uniref:Holliday junction branch migration protein RuvA n=1 Tax=Euzebya tangerina TaxID=591198 RepID=UPI000E321358|nr:Holliday junction branch migration protein RuvA [Euzebya tangerina]
MIAMLRGVVAHLSPGETIIDVAGVGYRVRVPTGARLAGLGEEITLHTHQVVREDALDLYGFVSADERDLFSTMLGVSGVGPKIALSGIDTLGASGLRTAVVADDVTALTAIPGVGKKGAQRLVLELRSKVGALPESSTADLPGGAPEAEDPRTEARQALGALGYGAGEVEHALRGLPTDVEAEELIRLALRGLATT